MSELVTIESVEELKSVDKSKSKQIKETFDPMVKMLEGFEKKYTSIINEADVAITGDVMARAKRLRLDIGKIRISAEKERVAIKREYMIAGKAIDGVNNLLKWAIVEKESKLKDIEQHFDRLEEERLKSLQTERVEKLSKYVEDASERDLGNMDKDVWDAYLGSKKQAHLDLIEAEKKAEADRLAKEKEYREEQERIRLENDKLKKEAEERERLAKIEQKKRDKEETERKAKAEAERKKHESELRKEREERERLEKEALEKQAKIEAEIKAKKDAELKAKAEAKKKAVAPEVERLNEWVDSFEVPELIGSSTDKSKEIESKFNSFKDWAKKEVSKMLEEVTK